MNENVLAAIAALVVPALARLGEWPVPDPRKISPGSRCSIVSAYSHFLVTPRFGNAPYQHFPGKNGSSLPFYISRADNSSSGGMRGYGI